MCLQTPTEVGFSIAGHKAGALFDTTIFSLSLNHTGKIVVGGGMPCVVFIDQEAVAGSCYEKGKRAGSVSNLFTDMYGYVVALMYSSPTTSHAAGCDSGETQVGGRV